MCLLNIVLHTNHHTNFATTPLGFRICCGAVEVELFEESVDSLELLYNRYTHYYYEVYSIYTHQHKYNMQHVYIHTQNEN